MPLRQPRRAGMILDTRQITSYHIGDNGDQRKGLTKRYTVLDAGQFNGTTAIDTPHYIAPTISFTAPDIITDSGNGLVTFLNTDTIRVRGSVSNDGVYTIASGGATAGHFHVTPNVVDEGAGAYVTICKRSTPSNNCVMDLVTGLMWRRYRTNATGTVERIGDASTGLLNWRSDTLTFTLHPSAADLQMMTTGIKIVGGKAELSRYFAGMVIICAGFANAINNFGGYRVTAVTVNGDDLDITLWTGKNTLIAEAAADSRNIRVECRSIFSYAAAMNAVSFAGFNDWRVPDLNEVLSLSTYEAPSCGVPDTGAFPNWPTTGIWTSTHDPSTVNTKAIRVQYSTVSISSDTKANQSYSVILVRG